MSLRLRLTLTYALVTALLVGTLGTILYFSMRGSLAREMDARLQVRAEEVQVALWPGPNAPTAADLAPGKIDLSPLDQMNAPTISVRVLDPSGAILGSSNRLSPTPAPLDPAGFKQALQGKSRYSDQALPGDHPARLLTTPIRIGAKVGAVLEVVQSREVLAATMAGLRRMLLMVGAAGIVLAGGLGWLISYRGLQPLKAIAHQAGEIAAERNFSRRIDMAGSGRDEVARLASTIDGLLQRVDETVRAHREFLADTSHELRNPLLAMRTNLELLDRVRDGDAREECIREASLQVERMSRLVSDLLLLAHVESHLVLDVQPVDLSDAVKQAVHQAEAQAPRQRIVTKGVSPTRIPADEARVRQILANLIDNAAKHTPPEGLITVALLSRNGEVGLSVEDTGPGIAPDDLSHIFERGFRVSSGQVSGEPGYGLGLAIVKHLAEAHGGRVEAESQLGRGTRITVWLKKGQEKNLLALA